MRILLLTSSMSAGGAERVASTLANAWALRGDQVVLMPTFAGRLECYYDLSSYVRLVYLADRVTTRTRSAVNQFSRLCALRRFIASEQPAVIVSFLPNVNIAAVIASVGLDIPIVVCERTDPFVCPSPLKLRVACRFAYPFADALMVQTQAVASKYILSGRALRRIRVIPNPVPPQFVELVPLGGRPGGRRLLAVGRLSIEKQFDVLIRVFARLASSHSDWSLKIIGEGPLRTDLQQQIVALRLQSSVELCGRVADIADEFAHADAFVLTSGFEGFPNALLEAMAAGLPCVTFDCPSGPREITMDGQVALLVAPNDEVALELALERLMSDDELRKVLGIAARASVFQRFALKEVLQKWDSLFRELGCSH
ncbi:MAG: glycosyltransferase family 4 protein [Sulfuritalea sp.]|nr:glycosyltransferase family 4 protein [Sulfuritalea sp.]